MDSIIKNMVDISLSNLEATPENLKHIIINLEAKSIFDNENWSDADNIILKYLQDLNKIYNVNISPTESNSKTACVIGTMPYIYKKCGIDFSNESYKKLRIIFKQQMYKDNIAKVWIGAMPGLEMVFSYSAIEMRALGFPMKICCAIPCKDFSKKLINSSLDVYNETIRRSDIVKFISDEKYSQDLVRRRNNFLIEQSDIIYMVNDKKTKDIEELKQYAIQLNKDIKQIEIS